MKKEVKQTGEKKPGFFKKVGGFFSRIGTYFKEVFAETKKLSWPGKKELVGYTLAVIGFVDGSSHVGAGSRLQQRHRRTCQNRC